MAKRTERWFEVPGWDNEDPRPRSDYPEESVLFLDYIEAASRALSTSEFIAKHGVERDVLLPFLITRIPTIDEIQAYDEKTKKSGQRSERKIAMNKVSAMLFEISNDPEIRASQDVSGLCNLLALCIGSSQNTNSLALEAFADAFAGAWQSIANSRRATDRHAAKREILARAWRDVKAGTYGSAKACADAYARHYGAEVGTKASTLLKHFTAMAKKEGIKLPRGPRAKRV